MALPPKSYFHLSEIAERWSVRMEDLSCYALDGLLEISVMVVGVRVEVGTFEEAGNGWSRVPAFEEVLYGPQPVVAADLWPVFRNGAGVLEKLKPRTPNGFVAFGEALRIELRDLLVTRQERDRFEAEHGISVPEPNGGQEESAFRHNWDYSEVVLSGEVFRLGILQAQVVRLLHEASRGESPWVSGKLLLYGAGAQTCRLVDLFKGKPNWRSLIVSDGSGRYRLNLPERPVARVRHRAYRRFGFERSRSLGARVVAAEGRM
jgi:hypothetical protein